MVILGNMQNRVLNKYRRFLGDHFARKRFTRTNSTPFISFSFDDFPRSAFTNGASILEKHGVLGTFYISMGLLNTETSSGRIVSVEDLNNLKENGHEIGCHTFNHYDGWSTKLNFLEQSVIQNHNAFRKIYSNECLRSFAYPIHGPKPKTKRVIGKHFLCCRGGGQTLNSREIDLNLLKACFLDWRNHDNLLPIIKLIERNSLEGGWLIFATHDVSNEPSKYGCSTTFFNEVVRYALESDATILPIVRTCQELGIDQS